MTDNSTPAPPEAGLLPALEPDYAVPPGETLRDRLDELGMSQAELAVRTGLTTKHVNQVMQGLVPMSADVAQRLEYATGVPARLWNRLEADFRSAQVRLAQRDLVDQSVENWLRRMPVRELVRVGAISETPGDLVSRVQQLLTFFGVASAQAWERLWARPAAAFRQTQAFVIDDAAVAAWLRLGELAARGRTVTPFDGDALRALLPHLRTLTRKPIEESMPLARAELARVGVLVVLVPEIRGARAYGATRWISPTAALVQLSLRGKTDDALWYTLFHELGHVLLHSKREIYVEFDEEATSTDTAEDEPPQYSDGGPFLGLAPAKSGPDRRRRIDAEEEAQRFALRTLLGASADERLAAVRTTSDAYDLADNLDVAVSVVAARLAELGVWTYRQATALKTSVPSIDDLLGGPVDSPRPRPRGQRRHRRESIQRGEDGGA